MRQWLFLMVAICGLASTSGANDTVWGAGKHGEKVMASDYQPQMLACGAIKWVKKSDADGESASSPRSISKPARSRAKAALLTRS